MILYLSNSTETGLYNELLTEGKVSPGNQMQKFNNSIICGLSEFDEIAAVSVLQYEDIIAKRIEKQVGKIHYICAENRSGKFQKIYNILNLIKESGRVIQEKKPSYIICDAIALSPCYVANVLGKIYRIPTIGIITDLPGMLTKSKNPYAGIGRMRHFDGYVLLTKQMNEVVNPKGKPYLIMEGLCAPKVPNVCEIKAFPKTVLYTGSLWKNDAGIEYFTEGFIKANIPNCELHFYGNGELVSWINDINRSYANIKYLGSITNEEILKKQCEATLLINPRPSTEEFCKYSFPSKTIEYMSSGTAMMMTKLPGVPSEYFDYVYTIDEETADGVCDALKKVFEASREELIEKGKLAQKFILDNKSCFLQAKRMWDFINEV